MASTLSEFLNEELRNYSPTRIVLLTLGATLTIKTVYDVTNAGHLWTRTKMTFWRAVRSVSGPVINRAVRKAAVYITMPHKDGEFTALTLPESGLSQSDVLAIVKQLHVDLDVPYENGGLSGTVYHGGAGFTAFMNEVMNVFQWSNPLHVNVFGATRKMEAEVVSMVLHMYNGHVLSDGCGAMTSGGTESIVMAIRAYRNRGRDERGLASYSIVVPATAHPAFDKAVDYLNMSIIKVPVDEQTMRVDPYELERHIRFDTVAIVGSAPNFPYGVVDDIATLSEVAARHRVGLHVDCCLGGFVMPFIARTGRAAPVVDFRNPAVTSISCDTHKYGYGPKGSSIVLYRSIKLRAYQFSCVTEWPGGMYCSPCLSGSKPGNVIAGAWAAMVNTGMEGYVAACDRLLRTREYVTAELAKLPFVCIFGDPTASVFAFGSNAIDIFKLGEKLEAEGWYLNRLQFPSGLQFSLTLMQTDPGVAEHFVKDVSTLGSHLYEEELNHIAAGNKSQTGQSSSSVYGVAQRIPDRSIVSDVQREFLNAYYRA